MSITAVISVTQGISVNVSVGQKNYGQYFTFTDGTNTYRKGIRNGYIVEDVALTSTGFDGTIGIDWENRVQELI